MFAEERRLCFRQSRFSIASFDTLAFEDEQEDVDEFVDALQLLLEVRSHSLSTTICCEERSHKGKRGNFEQFNGKLRASKQAGCAAAEVTNAARA